MASVSSSLIQAIRVEDGIFWFDLEETIVSAIREIKTQPSLPPRTLFLKVPRWLRRWLRKASVFDIAEETAKVPQNSRIFPHPPNLQQSGMTFISCYPCGKTDAKDKTVYILETIVTLDGDVLNKVQAQLLDLELTEDQDAESISVEDISAAHFWFIDQLLLALRQETDLLLNLATWASLGIPIGLGIASIWSDGELQMEDAIGPFIGSGISSLAYSVKDYWTPWLHARLSQWGWGFVKKQLGFSD